MLIVLRNGDPNGVQFEANSFSDEIMKCVRFVFKKDNS